MSTAKMSPQTRRELLRRMTALSAVGAAASPFGLQLAAMGSAAAQTAPSTYRAIVCLFLYGGNDANNMILPTDADSWGRYVAARRTNQQTPIALMPVGAAATPVGQTNPVTGRVVASTADPEFWGGVLPITSAIPNPVPAGTTASARTFALSPHMSALLPLWTGGRLAVMANVGPLIVPTTKTQYKNRSVALPVNLMSHNDQQSTWQAGAAEGARKGWGGLMADLILSGNGSNGIFTAISTSGNAVFLAGQNVVQYQVTTSNTPAVQIGAATASSVFGASGAGAVVQQLIKDVTPASYFMQDYDATVVRSMNAATTLNTTFATPAISGIAAPTPMLNPISQKTQTNSLAVQLQTVARLIAANQTFGVKRQVFFVSIGGFDTHTLQDANQPPLLASIAHALSYFDGALANLNGVDMRPQVTTFTASDFNRTYTANGTGTDHAWGSFHFVSGGAVKSSSVYGQYPTVGVDQGTFVNPDMLGNVLVPTMSVDQYGATLGKWFGITDPQLNAIFPNLVNFSTRDLGFLTP